MIQLRGLDARLKPYVEATISYANKLGIYPTITSVRRTWAQQAKLYAEFQAGGRRYPAAPPGNSGHQYGVAWDSVVPAGQVDAWVQIRRAFGWNVPQNDLIHAELPQWRDFRGSLSLS